jgi:hypothetical protein
MLAEISGCFAGVGSLGDRRAMAGRVLAGAGRMTDLNRAGALRNGRSFFAVVKAVGRSRGLGLAEAGELALALLDLRLGQRLDYQGCITW